GAQRRRVDPHLDRPARRLRAAARAPGGGAPEQRAPARGVPAPLLRLRGGHRRDRGAGRRGLPRGAAVHRRPGGL
ncbi:MAG: 3-dehydroquinate dehydratase II, partial [uncultured Quadrisphaera sp.]